MEQKDHKKELLKNLDIDINELEKIVNNLQKEVNELELKTKKKQIIANELNKFIEENKSN